LIVVKELGYLALAIVQAGAYICKTQYGLDHYLKMYHEFCGNLLEEYCDEVHKMDDYKWTVYTTWTMSFDRLNEKAVKFLQLCAFFHHDGISELIFQNTVTNMADMVLDAHKDPEG
jgi:hypothetical protein